MINWKLASHPLNWLTVIMMLLIAAIAGQLFMQYVGIQPATS